MEPVKTCGAAYDEDYYNSIFCERQLGHDGQHSTVRTWEQTEEEANEAQCELHGHIWGEWEPYKEPVVVSKPLEPFTKRDDISLYLLGSLISAGGPPPKEIHACTKTRHCTRCNKYDNDAEYDFSTGTFFYANPFPEGATVKWTEDRLQNSLDQDDHKDNHDQQNDDAH
jgi:hypothetical protein